MEPTREAFRSSTRSWLVTMAVVTVLAGGWGVVSGQVLAAGVGVAVGAAMCAFFGWALWTSRERR